MCSNELLMGNLEAANFPGQRQRALLVIRIQDMLEHLGVKVCPDVTVTLLDGGLHGLRSAGVCCACK